jgi:pyruvate ferredoxin oxidoreductase gamma subunit
MEKVFELEFIGRGGQGGKTAADLVGVIAIKKGKYIQSFPDYGPERKGAPVRSFTRISDKEIRGCSSEANPDVIVIIDPTLLALNGTLFTIKEGQVVLINSAEKSEDVKKRLGVDAKIYTVNATKIALESIKRNVTNSPMLGALSKATNLFTLEEIKEEFREEFKDKLDNELLEKNYLAMDHAYNEAR